jgi:NhaP-type Na+/H+ or K+/H+ antiporter
MTHPASGTLRSRRELALAGAGLILIAGLIHLLLTPQHFAEAAYLGALSAPTSPPRS